MLEISEGDIEFLYTMKLMPPKCLRSIIYPYIIYKKYYSLKVLTLFILALFIDKHVFAYIISFKALYKNLRTSTELLEMYGKGASINEFSITQ
jgi:hypothetical protein